jgi:mono/diheme cytochrome c family protein
LIKWAIAAVAVLACLASAANAQPLFSPEQDPIAGARVFGAKGCVKCHSIEGLGGKIGPDLARTQRPQSFYTVAAAMWNHLPHMAVKMNQFDIKRPKLVPSEAASLIAFLYTLDYFDPRGDVGAGKRLFTEKKCILCHQLNGAGGVIGPNLDGMKRYGSALFIAAAMWNHGPTMSATMRVKGIERPTFSGSELVDLIAYIKSNAAKNVDAPVSVLPGSAERGGRLFSDKHCIECHSVGSRGGGKVGPDLAAKALHKSMTDFAAAMWNKAPAMLNEMKTRKVAVPRLEAADMADIVAYLYAVNYFALPGDVQRGRVIAAQKGCLACHSVDANNKGALNLAAVKGLDSPATLIAAMWNHSFVASPSSAREWPRFSAEEMADLAAYLQALNRRPS